MDPTAHALGQTPLFVDFSEAELQRLSAQVRRRSYREGRVVFEEGEPGDGLYVILSGTVKISLASPEGDETVIALLAHGECFGEMAVVDGRPRSATATALEAAEVL